MLWVCLFFLSSSAFAHGDHEHAAAVEAGAAAAPAEVNQKINEAYLQRIKPIFDEKCMDCHSDHTRWPDYYKIPGIKQFIDSDIREGREHLDFSKDYPFISHAKPIEDLDAIRKEIDEGEMPPFLYRLMHRDTAITPDEKRVIFDWVDWAKAQLQANSTK